MDHHTYATICRGIACSREMIHTAERLRRETATRLHDAEQISARAAALLRDLESRGPPASRPQETAPPAPALVPVPSCPVVPGSRHPEGRERRLQGDRDG